tara:strand:- start:463 stop:1437 length:975 start_codon:yes stop_codon:yes gene_type:complete
MSYLGRGLEQVDNISKLDNITFNGGTTYALTKDSAAFTPISSNALLVSIDGVIQQGNFSVSGTNIVFNFSPTGSNTCDFIMHYGTGVAFTPADSSITKDKTNFVSTSSAAGLEVKGDGTTDGTLQLNCRVNSHGVKLKSPPHSAGQSYTLTLPSTSPSADKFLKTDGSGNLSFDSAGGDNSPILSVGLSSTQTLTDNTWATLVFQTEILDANNIYDNSTGVATPTAGTYLMIFAANVGGSGAQALDNCGVKFLISGTVYAEQTMNQGGNQGRYANLVTSYIHTFNGSQTVACQAYADITSGTPNVYGGGTERFGATFQMVKLIT